MVECFVHRSWSTRQCHVYIYPAACGKSRHRASPALWVATDDGDDDGDGGGDENDDCDGDDDDDEA